jgi:hypothetical protein
MVAAARQPVPRRRANLMLVPTAQNLIAFRTSAVAAVTSSAARDNGHYASPKPATGGLVIIGP